MRKFKFKSNMLGEFCVIGLVLFGIYYIVYNTSLFRLVEGMNNGNSLKKKSNTTLTPPNNSQGAAISGSGGTPSSDSYSDSKLETDPSEVDVNKFMVEEENIQIPASTWEKMQAAAAATTTKTAGTNTKTAAPKIGTGTQMTTEGSVPVKDKEGVNNKEGFTQMHPAPVTGSASCYNPLLPYANNHCGPININKSFFDNIHFKPECCPSTYSSSSGCACMCPEQLKYLNSRGGNRSQVSMF